MGYAIESVGGLPHELRDAGNGYGQLPGMAENLAGKTRIRRLPSCFRLYVCLLVSHTIHRPKSFFSFGAGYEDAGHGAPQSRLSGRDQTPAAAPLV